MENKTRRSVSAVERKKKKNNNNKEGRTDSLWAEWPNTAVWHSRRAPRGGSGSPSGRWAPARKCAPIRSGWRRVFPMPTRPTSAKTHRHPLPSTTWPIWCYRFPPSSSFSSIVVFSSAFVLSFFLHFLRLSPSEGCGRHEFTGRRCWISPDSFH